MANMLYEVRKDNRCYFQIIAYPQQKRISSTICLNWSGLINQFPNGISIEDAKLEAIKWLELKQRSGFDNQFSDRKSTKWLIESLKKSNQLDLFKTAAY